MSDRFWKLVLASSLGLAAATALVWILTAFIPVHHITPIPDNSLSVFQIGTGELAWFRTSRPGWSDRTGWAMRGRIPFGTLWIHRMLLERPSFDEVNWSIPFWLLFLALMALPAYRWTRGYVSTRHRRRCHDRGLCQVCGYNLRATPGRCPECGAVPEPRVRTAA